MRYLLVPLIVTSLATACRESVTKPADPDTPGQGSLPLTITSSALPSATVDVPYQTSLQASGGAPPYRWRLVGFLPPGLTADAAGRVAGTPGYPAGGYVFQIEVRDAEDATASADLTMDLQAASGLRVTSRQLSVGEQGQPYADTLEAEAGSPPYTFRWSYSILNEFEGLTIDSVTGVLSGTPLGATGPDGEEQEARVTVRDVVGASAFAMVQLGIRPGPLLITADLPNGRVGEGYLAPLTATGGFGSRVWTVVSGTLPPGLAIEPSSLYGVRLRGSPTTVGSYPFTLQVSSPEGVATREYTIVIAGSPLSIVSSTIPDAHVGAPYSVFLVRAGGTGPYEWDVVSGSPPSGMSLSTAGELNGVPMTAGDYSFEVRVRDAGGQSASSSLMLHVES